MEKETEHDIETEVIQGFKCSQCELYVEIQPRHGPHIYIYIDIPPSLLVPIKLKYFQCDTLPSLQPSCVYPVQGQPR